MASDRMDQAFIGAGVAPGLQIWRIEKMKVVPQEKSTYGEFYCGDSYIVLSTIKNARSGKLEWNIHFWLGEETSQDEKGVAAYKTVELDDLLGGAPVQYREVQDYESSLFLSYFKNGIKYLSGGVDSGFNKVVKGVYEKRLFHIKGKKNVRIKQVQCHHSSLNKGDVFLLDCGMTIHVWHGPQSSVFERLKGNEVATKIRDEERSGKADIRIISDRWQYDTRFFTALGSTGDIAEAEHGGDDMLFERQMSESVHLYRVTDASGELKIEEVGSDGTFNQNHLDSNDCFILDCGSTGMFVWIGRGCTRNEKKSAWKHAVEFLDTKGYPEWTKVTRLAEGGETPVFKQHFVQWKDFDSTDGLGVPYRMHSVAFVQEKDIDFSKLHERKECALEKSVQDFENIETEIWMIHGSQVEMQSEVKHGIFSACCCYVVWSKRKIDRMTSQVVYYWMGAKSSKETQASAAMQAQAVTLAKTQGCARQERMVQGKEPTEFMSIFGKCLIVFQQERDLEEDLFTIRFCVNSDYIWGYEISEFPTTLYTNQCIFIVKNLESYLWHGKSVDEEAVQIIYDTLSKVINLEDTHFETEGDETDHFRELVRSNYDLNFGLLPVKEENVARLFTCTTRTGRFEITETYSFTTEDLDSNEVILLDSEEKIYIWYGNGATSAEKLKALQSAMDYLSHDPNGRTQTTTPLLKICEDKETREFRCLFPFWYTQEHDEKLEHNEHCESVQEILEKHNKVYSYQDILGKRYPAEIDSTRKEDYLSLTEFRHVFGMEKDAFRKLPKWKQGLLKKQVNLF